MDAIFRGQGQHVKRTVTAFGGALAGALLCGLVCLGGAWYQITSERTAHETALSKLNASSKREKGELSAMLKALEEQQGCDGLELVIRSREASVRRLQKITNEFPQFKTEPFKGIHNRLQEEATKQLEDLAKLQDVLKSAEIGVRERCILSNGKSNLPTLWEADSLVLNAEGWKVVPK